MRTYGFRLGSAFLSLALLAGCTVKDTETPALAGPSELALSLNVTAVPDSILHDGASQSAVTVEARGADGQPVRGLGLRAQTFLNGEALDFGTLSAKTVVTGDDGRARLTYTAPPPPNESVGQGTVVTLAVTPMGNDYRQEQFRQVDILLVPRGVILPVNGVPVAGFNFSPAGSISTYTTITFDASPTTDEGRPCGTDCTYNWSFGDGGTGTGLVTTHEWRAPGSYVVTLRATDQRGLSGTTTQTVTVQAATPPTAAFSFSPTQPAISQTIFFTAEASRPAQGRRIVSYDWNFGSGRNATGVTATKAYDSAGTYNVTLTVTDDANQQGTISLPVTVGGQGTGLTAVFTFSPTSPTPTTNVFFDASASRGPSPITQYRFTWGDNTPDVVGTSATTGHQFPGAGIYVVRLTVTDSLNRTATTTQNVTVTP